MRSFLKRTLPMDEIKDLRTHARERFDQGEIRYQFESDRVHVDRIDTIASAMASVAPLRRRPTLRVIQGGLHGEPKGVLREFARDWPFLVVVK
jgi:hypothetical protein